MYVCTHSICAHLGQSCTPSYLTLLTVVRKGDWLCDLPEEKSEKVTASARKKCMDYTLLAVSTTTQSRLANDLKFLFMRPDRTPCDIHARLGSRLQQISFEKVRKGSKK